MPKEIDESKLNYNKYPGEHVVALEDVVQVGTRTFHLVANYREAFDAEKLEQRFSDVFDKYDYIVGDWGFEQLRLKGFFSASRRKMAADNKIDRLEDYINEYCNYGCAYFVLRRVRTKDEAFISEKIFTEKEVRQKLDKPRRKRNRNRNRQRESVEDNKDTASKGFEIREKMSQNKQKNTDQSVSNKKKAEGRSEKKFAMKERPKRSQHAKDKPKEQAGQGFVIRTRGKD